MTDGYLTVEELAERYRTTASSVHKWVHQGTAPRSLKVGRRRLFPHDAVVAWEEAHTTDSEPAA